MKKFDIQGNVDSSGEFILGAKDTGSHACYLIYGVLKPGEKKRELKPGKGHEELFFVIQGPILISGDQTGTLREGEAIHVKGEEACWLENTSDKDAFYVIAGGHSGTGHH